MPREECVQADIAATELLVEITVTACIPR